MAAKPMLELATMKARFLGCVGFEGFRSTLQEEQECYLRLRTVVLTESRIDDSLRLDLLGSGSRTVDPMAYGYL